MQDNFKLYFERSGGFAGITLNVEIDSEELSPEERDKLLTLITNSSLLEITKKDSSVRNMPDQFNYRITLVSNKKSFEIELVDSTITDNLRALITYLERKAKTKRN